MRPRSISFIRNALSAYAPFLVDLFLKMAVIRMILFQDGAETVGLWGLLKAILALPLFLQEGVCFAIFLDSAANRSSRLGEVIGFSTITGLIVAVFFLVLAPLFPVFFQVPPHQQSDMFLAFRISAVVFAASAPAQALLYAIRGNGRFDVVAGLLIANSILNFILVTYFLVRGHGVIGLILADLICAFLLLGTAIYFFKRLFKPESSLFEWNAIRIWALAKRTAAQLFYSATAKTFWELDALLIPRFFGIPTMAGYWIGRRIPYVFGDFLWAGIWPAVPATQNGADRNVTVVRIHWLQAALLVPWSIFLFVTAPQILQLWTGMSDPVAVMSMRVLLLAVVFDFLPATAISYFFGQGKVLLIAGALFFAVLLKTAIAIYACWTQQLQLLLISTSISALVFAIVVLVLLFKHTTIPFYKMLRPIAAFSLASAFAFSMLNFLPIHSGLFGLVFKVAIFGCLTYAASFFLLRVFYPNGFSALVRVAVQKSNLFHVLYATPYAALRRASIGSERFQNKRMERFENVYQNKEDPWDYQTSEYERQKYSKMHEFLSSRRFANALEVGCSEGVFTVRLAELSANVIGLDISSTAIQRAKEHSRAYNNIDLRRFDVVNDIVPSGMDLICCGEVLNCLPSPKQLEHVRNKLLDALVPGGWLLLVNLHLFPDDRKGLVLKDMGFGSTHIRNLFLSSNQLNVLRDEDQEGYRITLFEKKSV